MTGSTLTSTTQQQNIEKASKSVNPLDIPDCTTFESNDLHVSIQCKRKADMDPKQLKWAFKLAETNVGPYYKTCAMGWQPKIKQNDLNKVRGIHKFTKTYKKY